VDGGRVGPIGPTGGCLRVFQIHPTRRCNLRCLHCYSESGPRESAQLDQELLRVAICDAREQGYTLVGFSGGEPLMYAPLPALLTHARSLGMITTVTTNGMLLTERKLGELADRVDLIAISLDGVPTSHNKIRAYGGAFEKMAARLNGLRQSGIPFGFIFTLTMFNVHELRWVADFARDQGACLLQIHPLEEAGRAARRMRGEEPDGTEAAAAYVEALKIQAMVGERLQVHLDLAPKEVLREEPARVFADPLVEGWENWPLADLVNPLIVEADGAVVPIQHGFDRRFALGNLQNESLLEMSARWRGNRYREFRTLCKSAWKKATSRGVIQLVNWYGVIHNQARTHTSSRRPELRSS